MLSKEEIEKAKDFMIFYKNYCLNKETVNTEHYETVNNEEFVYKNIETILEYIDQLESREQKLIEKLEERIKAVDKCYNELLTDVGGIKIINVTGLTKEEKEEIINKRNCLLVQKYCYEEILEILEKE